MRETIVTLLVMAAALTALGCGSRTETATEETRTGPQAAAVQETTASSEDDAAILAAADEADGTVDSVVHRCAVCGLAMDGSPEHASYYKTYTFHLCSSHCKETFDHDPAAVLARLEPEPEPGG